MKFNIGDRVQTKITRTPGTVRRISNGLVAVETDDPIKGVPINVFSISHGLFLSEDEWEKIPPSKIVITSDGKTTLARLYDCKRVIRRAEAKCSPEDTYDFATGANLAYDRLMRPETLTASVKPYAEPSKLTTPANKYDAMSDDDLLFAVCDMGTCSASASDIRHADCPFKNTPAYNSPTTHCSGYLRAHPEFRPVLVQYLADEDAAKEPKPEPKPVKHLYNGKVVCVETHDDFTVGRVYTFAQGKVTDDGLWRRPMSGYGAESLEDWNSRCGDCIARFIEYKGEA